MIKKILRLFVLILMISFIFYPYRYGLSYYVTSERVPIEKPLNIIFKNQLQKNEIISIENPSILNSLYSETKVSFYYRNKIHYIYISSSDMKPAQNNFVFVKNKHIKIYSTSISLKNKTKKESFYFLNSFRVIEISINRVKKFRKEMDKELKNSI